MKIVWTKEKYGPDQFDFTYTASMLVGLVGLSVYRKSKDKWQASLGHYNLGFYPTSNAAKSACRSAWHKLLKTGVVNIKHTVTCKDCGKSEAKETDDYKHFVFYLENLGWRPYYNHWQCKECRMRQLEIIERGK